MLSASDSCCPPAQQAAALRNAGPLNAALADPPGLRDSLISRIAFRSRQKHPPTGIDCSSLPPYWFTRMDHNSSMFLQQFLRPHFGWLYASSYLWTGVGFLGNTLFGSRFVFQWIASERSHQLVVPPFFWHLSFWGSVLNLLYALHLDNAPLLFGVSLLPFIYGRNLMLLYRKNNPVSPPRAARRTEAKSIEFATASPPAST